MFPWLKDALPRNQLVLGGAGRVRLSNQGFTLTEAMVASFVAVIGLASVLVSLSAIKRTSVLIEAQSVAVHGARQEMETLLSCPYDDARLTPGTHVIGGTLGGVYSVSSNAAFGQTKNIVLDMYWVDPRSGLTSTVSLASSISHAMHK